MEPMALLAVVVLLGLVAAVVHQWVLDSSLFEFGAESWFPTDGSLPVSTAVVRSALSGVIPLVATTVAAVLVVTAPFRVWVWGVVGLLAVTVTLSPILAVYHYRVRSPTPAEEAVLDELPDVDCEVLVITDARDGPVNGYAIGGPFRDVVGISEFALASLPTEQIAALLAHEACHHHERHVLVRGGVSVAILAVGAAVTTALFDALVPPATLCLFATIAVERVVAFGVIRRLEYRADAVAAGRTSVDAVVSLLRTLERAADVDPTAVSRLLRVFSTHPTYADRIARVQT